MYAGLPDIWYCEDTCISTVLQSSARGYNECTYHMLVLQILSGMYSDETRAHCPLRYKSQPLAHTLTRMASVVCLTVTFSLRKVVRPTVTFSTRERVRTSSRRIFPSLPVTLIEMAGGSLHGRTVRLVCTNRKSHRTDVHSSLVVQLEVVDWICWRARQVPLTWGVAEGVVSVGRTTEEQFERSRGMDVFGMS